MTCNCKDWKPNIDIIDSYIVMDSIHVWGNKAGYTGKPFLFCPWCGDKLKKEKAKKESNGAR